MKNSAINYKEKSRPTLNAIKSSYDLLIMKYCRWYRPRQASGLCNRPLSRSAILDLLAIKEIRHSRRFERRRNINKKILSPSTNSVAAVFVMPARQPRTLLIKASQKDLTAVLAYKACPCEQSSSNTPPERTTT
jgi:hypothetical protein